MQTTRVNNLLRRLREEPAPDAIHTQTVKITERSHQKLRAMSELYGRHKTGLANELLMAAIDDAIEMLRSEPTPMSIERVAGVQEPVSLGEYIEHRAEELYREYLDEREAAAYRHGNHVQEDAASV